MIAVIPVKGECIRPTLRYETQINYCERLTHLNTGRSSRARAGVMASSVWTEWTLSVSSSCTVSAAPGAIGAAVAIAGAGLALMRMTSDDMVSNVA